MSIEKYKISTAGKCFVKVCFLLDENLPPRLTLANLRLNSEIDILRYLQLSQS